MSQLTDREVVSRYKLDSKNKILDIGGSMKQREEINVDTLVDIIRPEEAPYGPSKLKAKNFIKVDITREKLPFKKNEFDFCLCTHTLEDLSTPFLAIEEMSRVAKRGLIVTPSMGNDMVFSHLDTTNWLTGARRVPGHGHHKWFFVKAGKKLKIMPKNYPILYTSKFHIVDWNGEDEMVFYWEDEIDYEEVLSLKIHDLINEYERYVEKNKEKLVFGKPIFYLDSPIFILKAYLKLLFKKGSGFEEKSAK